jgi:hypothetical protein
MKQEWQKSPTGTRQTDGKSLVWFGEIESKLAKLSKTNFTYRSSSLLFYGDDHSASALEEPSLSIYQILLTKEVGTIHCPFIYNEERERRQLLFHFISTSFVYFNTKYPLEFHLCLPRMNIFSIFLHFSLIFFHNCLFSSCFLTFFNSLAALTVRSPHSPGQIRIGMH